MLIQKNEIDRRPQSKEEQQTTCNYNRETRLYVAWLLNATRDDSKLCVLPSNPVAPDCSAGMASIVSLLRGT